eukprot:TRINITY_DN36979_c0_g1_i1.p1 TRINITY_DN36979_c0_g1~~TRINITY_DN36979_c0_g1_i1.p1  ORF type:complete len:694 (-),score=158.09 TRINITY_DN36979_c0_g1_i1:27-1916(-)
MARALTIEPKLHVPASSFTPYFVAMDKKTLRFDAFFLEEIDTHGLEKQRIHKVRIFYHLVDHTISVIEPRQENSGVPQGALIRRHRIPKPHCSEESYTFSDFNIGAEVTFYGKVFHIINCDGFTRAFLSGQGLSVPAPEESPRDAIVDKLETKRGRQIRGPARRLEDDKLFRFLQNDKKVLRFYCVWDDRAAMYGDRHLYTLCYFLTDDTVKVTKTHEGVSWNKRDPFGMLLRREKLPCPNAPGTFYTDADLRVGETISVFGRDFMPYDCDEFTRAYYIEKFEFEQGKISIAEPEPAKPVFEIPPHNGVGSEEDSMGNVKSLNPKPPKRDMRKMIEKERDILRFLARLESSSPDDESRRFVVAVYVVDDTVQINEHHERNPGFDSMGHRFLQRSRVHAPDGKRYTARDFCIGARVVINSHAFTLLKADEFSLKYMEEHYDQFPVGDMSHIEEKVREAFAGSSLYDTFHKADQDKNGWLSPNEFMEAIRETGVLHHVNEHELVTVMRTFDRNSDGRIDYEEFVQAVGGKRAVGLSDAAWEATEDLLCHLNDVLEGKEDLLQNALAARDENDEGVLPIRDIQDAFLEVGISLKDTDATLLERGFTVPEGSGVIWSELLRAMLGSDSLPPAA